MVDKDKKKHVKMYILIKDWVDTGHAVNTAAHCGAEVGRLWPPTYELQGEYTEVEEWWDTHFRKVTCKVTEQQFKKAKEYEDWSVITELFYDGQEVALAFKPRRDWPKFFNFLTLWGKTKKPLSEYEKE